MTGLLMQARAGEIEAALAASEAELDRQESVSRAATQVWSDCLASSSPWLHPMAC